MGEQKQVAWLSWIPFLCVGYDPDFCVMDSAEPDEILKRKYLARGPGDAATREYVVNKYLGGGGAGDSDETEKRKKKKKKVKSTIRKGNLGIVDEDDFGWKQIDPDQEDERQRAKREELERIEREAAANSKGVFRGKTEGWHTIQEGVPSETREDEMPAIVTETKEEEEEVLRVLGRQEVTEKQRNEGSTGEGPRMSSGQRAGLLTSDEIKREAARAREAERQIINTLEQDSGQYAETIYRDETGRKIDPKIKRAEEARARKEAMEREERRMEWGKGVVQRNEAEEQRRRLEEEKHKPLARQVMKSVYPGEGGRKGAMTGDTRVKLSCCLWVGGRELIIAWEIWCINIIAFFP